MQAINVLRNLVHAEMNARFSKSGLSPLPLIKSRKYWLIFCAQANIRVPSSKSFPTVKSNRFLNTNFSARYTRVLKLTGSFRKSCAL